MREGHRVHSDADEGGGGQRNVAGRTRKERPGRRQGDIGEVHDARRHAVGRKAQRQRGENGDADSRRQE